MGKQYNKVIKRKRRRSYVLRKDAAQAAAVKVKTAPARTAPKAKAPARAPKSVKSAPAPAETPEAAA